jgi:preprotein translocase subunit SecD
MVVEQSLETIRNRVDQFGISEPEIIPQGEDRIVVQLPGIKDTARAKNLIGKQRFWNSNSLMKSTAWTAPSRAMYLKVVVYFMKVDLIDKRDVGQLHPYC